MEAEWNAPARRTGDDITPPVLSIEGFEGPLDWFVELARARRFDLQRISMLALIEAFEAALLEAFDDAVSPAVLARWGDWLVLAAELTLLRTRLMLRFPAELDDAKREADALRQRLIGRAEMAAAASWLARRPQIGIEVFERGAPEIARSVRPDRAGDLTALLRACLMVLAVPDDAAAAFRIVVPVWSIADAVGRMRQLLAEMSDEAVPLEAFVFVVRFDAPDRERRCSAALASTFAGGLELAREGVLSLSQARPMGSIRVAAREGMTCE